MPLYRTTFALRPELNEDERDSVLKKISDVIIKQKGEVESVDLKGMQKLAYEVNKAKEGFFVSTNFQVDSSKMSKIQEFFTKNREIIRIMIIRGKALADKKSIDEKNKGGEKNERAESGGSDRKSDAGP